MLDPFTMTLKEFFGLDDEKIKELFAAAYAKSSDFVLKYFKENPDIAWIVIAKGKTNVVAFGRKNEGIDRRRIRELAEKFNTPVFTYIRTFRRDTKIYINKPANC